MGFKFVSSCFRFLAEALRPERYVDAGENHRIAKGEGSSVRLDYINRVGPTDARVTVDSVTLTNTSQL